jgi:hypothetical protein
MITHTIILNKDRLAKKSDPLDEKGFYEILQHDFNGADPKSRFRFHSIENKTLSENQEIRDTYGTYS